MIRFAVYGRRGERVGRIHAMPGATLEAVARSFARSHGPLCMAWIEGPKTAEITDSAGNRLARLVLEEGGGSLN